MLFRKLFQGSQLSAKAKRVQSQETVKNTQDTCYNMIVELVQFLEHARRYPATKTRIRKTVILHIAINHHGKHLLNSIVHAKQLS